MLRFNRNTRNLEIICDHCELPIPTLCEGVVQAELKVLPDGTYSETTSNLTVLHTKCIAPHLRSFTKTKVGSYIRDNLEYVFREVLA